MTEKYNKLNQEIREKTVHSTTDAEGFSNRDLNALIRGEKSVEEIKAGITPVKNRLTPDEIFDALEYADKNPGTKWEDAVNYIVDLRQEKLKENSRMNAFIRGAKRIQKGAKDETQGK